MLAATASTSKRGPRPLHEWHGGFIGAWTPCLDARTCIAFTHALASPASCSPASLLAHSVQGGPSPMEEDWQGLFDTLQIEPQGGADPHAGGAPTLSPPTPEGGACSPQTSECGGAGTGTCGRAQVPGWGHSLSLEMPRVVLAITPSLCGLQPLGITLTF